MTMKWSLKVIFRQEKITLNEFVFVTIISTLSLFIHVFWIKRF